MRYDTRCYFNVRSNADIIIYSTERKKLKSGKQKKLKSKINGYAQKYRQTFQEICGVSPEEEKKATLRRICRKGRF